MYALRAKMQVVENPTFTADYYAPDKRYIGNATQVIFRDGTASERVEVDFPIDHRKRRSEGMPVSDFMAARQRDVSTSALT